MATVPPLPIPGEIPPFTVSGTLPPFLGANPAIPATMSPYVTTLVKLVERFATSPQRKEILSGYLSHREALLGLGITGLQWLDGSFLEDIEALEGRPPGDLDIVTFAWRPAHIMNDQAAWEALIQGNLHLFDPAQSKPAFRTDPYYVDVRFGPELVIQQTAYWFGLFSHKRISSLWKGILVIPLDQSQDDAAAIQLLATK
jgi:hypothetical protein